MGLVSIRDVRKLCGHPPIANRGIKLGTADGSGKTFYIPGRYIVDGDGDDVITAGSDVVMYDDGVSVAIDYILPERGMIVLASAPVISSVMTADFFSSELPDSEIRAEIDLEQASLERKTHSKFSNDNTKIQYWSGDGVSVDFFFEFKPAYSIVSYDIDGVTSGLTENTDYWLYPESEKFDQIRFLNTPVLDNKNVNITYLYGERDVIAHKWIKYSTARTLVLHELSVKGFKGVYSPPNREQTYPSDNKAFTLFKSLGALLDEIKSDISYVMGIDLV